MSNAFYILKRVETYRDVDTYRDATNTEVPYEYEVHRFELTDGESIEPHMNDIHTLIAADRIRERNYPRSNYVTTYRLDKKVTTVVEHFL